MRGRIEIGQPGSGIHSLNPLCPLLPVRSWMWPLHGPEHRRGGLGGPGTSEKRGVLSLPCQEGFGAGGAGRTAGDGCCPDSLPSMGRARLGRERESITFCEDVHFLFSACESWILPEVFSLSLSPISLLVSLYLYKGLESRPISRSGCLSLWPFPSLCGASACVCVCVCVCVCLCQSPERGSCAGIPFGIR